MAFYVNDSANTSHPLMDAIVKYSKIILDDMVLKNEELGDKYETESSIEWADYLFAVKNGSMRLSFFPAESLYDYLQEYGYSPQLSFELVEDTSKIPSEEYQKILEYCNARFLEEYEEENLYYRRLNGLPPYNTDEFDVYIDYETFGSYLDIDNAYTDFDFSKPIHEYSVTEITTLETLGIIDILCEKYISNNEDPDSREGYKYLRFLGGKKIDVYTARKANNWDILYMPPVDIYVSKRFRELFEANRVIYERKINQLAYSVRSDHFQEMVMFMIVCQTFNDMIVDTPEWYIRRDVIDLRSVQYFLESQGVKFFEDIPMRYQIRIVKNLNRLIRYKSTDKNINDILEIFATEDAQVYQYYLLKKYRTTDLGQHTITGIPPLPDVWYLKDEYDYGYEYGEDEEEPEEDPEIPGLIHDPSVDYDEDGNEIYDFQDFDDPDYIVNDEILFMYDFESEESPNILPTSVLPFDQNGNQVLDAWYEDTEFERDDEDHTNILNSTGDGYGNDMVGDDPLGDPYITFDYGMEIANSEEDDLAKFEQYTYDFGWDDEHIIDDYKTTQKKEEYEQATKIIKDEYGNIYDLEFVKVPINDQYDNYIKDASYRVDYDSITLYDKYWDGEDTHSYIKNQHLQTSYYDNGVYREHDFTVEGTKFMGLEFDVSLSQFSYEQNYYLGMLLNTKIDVSAINIGIPSIKQNTYFNIRNIILFLYCCNGLYTGEDIDVNDPSHAVIKRTNNEIPEFEAYTDIDGGYVWNGDGKEDHKKEGPWEVPDLDFETFDPEDEINLKEIIDCGCEEDYVYFDLEFDGDILDYCDDDYYVIPAHMDSDYEFGDEELYPNQILDMTGAQIYDFDYDSKYPIDNSKTDFSNLWEFGNEDGYPLYEDYETQMKEFWEDIERENNIYHTVDDIVEGDDEDIPKDEWYDYKTKINMEFGYEDLEEYLEYTAVDYTNYIFPFDDVSNDPMFREDQLTDGGDEDDIRARVQDELSEMGNEDYIQKLDLTEPQSFTDGDYDFAYFDELHPRVRSLPLPIPAFWLDNSIDECGDESPNIENFEIEDAVFGDEDDESDTEVDYIPFEGPCEDDEHPADITAMCDYGYEDDGCYIKFIGEDYDCGDEDLVSGIMDTSNAIDLDFNTFHWDYDAMTDEEKDVYYNGINGGNEDNSELEPVPGSIIVSIYDNVNGYDREDTDVMHIVYDFGYHYDLDPLDYLYDYDYGEITPNSIDSDEILAREKAEKEPYFHNMDFGYEDKDTILYTQYTVVYEMGDYVSGDADPVYDNPNLVAFGDSINDAEDESEDEEEIIETWDFGEITEDSDDTIEPDEIEYDDDVFRFYTDEKWYHEVWVTPGNCTKIIGQYYINQKNGDLQKITVDNCTGFIGRHISYLDWWWNIEDHEYYDQDYDGNSPGELDLVINANNYEMIIGQQYVDPLTGNIEVISRSKAYSYTYSNVVFIITEENKTKFVNSEYYNADNEEYYEITWSNIDDLLNIATRYYNGRITIKVNINNYKKLIGLTYIDKESDDEFEFTYDYAQQKIQTVVSILDWYWNNTNRDFLNTYYLNIDGGRVPYCLVTKSDFYDYIRTDHSLMFKDCMGRIYGFNMAVELEQLQDDIGFNHSRFGFTRSYTLKELGCDTYIVQRKFDDLRDLYRVYENNTKCYNNLKYLYENSGTRDDKRVMEYVFYTLFTRPYDMEFYIINNGDIATTYDQVLHKHDHTLYNKYLELQENINATTRIYNIRNIMNELVDTLNYYINTETLKYALSFIYTSSFDAMLTYMQEVIDFFKSWKVQFVARKINYLLGDKMNNMSVYGDQIGEIKTKYYGPANGFMADALHIQTLYFPEDNKDMTQTNFEASVVDLGAHYVDDDIFMDRDFDGCEISKEYIYDGEVCLELNGGKFYIDDSDKVCCDMDNSYFIQVNGGRVDKFIDLYDLDGGGVRDLRDNAEYVDANVINDGTVGYCDIDGGNFTDKYIGIDYMEDGKNNPNIGISRKPYNYKLADPSPEKQDFKSYDVNGGNPNIHIVYTQTAITNISNFNEVSVDVRIAPQSTNGLEVRYTDEGEPPIWPMRNIDFGDENIPDEIFDYGDLDNASDTLIVGVEDAYGNEDGDVRSYENSIHGMDSYFREDDENYAEIDMMFVLELNDYGEITEDSDDTVEVYKDIYGNEDESEFSSENLVTGTDDYTNPNDDYEFLLSYKLNRSSKNVVIYDFGNEDIDTAGYITDETTDELLVYDYGEIVSTSDASEDFVEPDSSISQVGLYFDYTKYASDRSITNNTSAINGYGENIAKELNAMTNITRIVKDRESIEEYIQSIYDKKLESMSYILGKFAAGEQAYTEGMLKYCESVYKDNMFFWYKEVEPFVWTDFAGNKIRSNSA